MSTPPGRDFEPPWRWGIFRRAPCRTLLIDTSSPDYMPMTAIYGALKGVGFRETYWQFVYPGQIGGLVKTPRSTLLEFHVRFFEGGRIYAEMELGRSVLLHFLNRRCYINRYITKKLSSRLSSTQLVYLQLSTERYKRDYPNNWPEWTNAHRFVNHRTKMQIRFLTVLSDWRVLALIMMASFAASITRGPILLPLLTALMIVIYLLAPKRS